MTKDKLRSRNGNGFAPPDRATVAEVGDQADLCLNSPVIQAVLDAVDTYAVVLNAQRQMVATNPAILDALSDEDPAACRGLRMGEALGCVHAAEGPAGCGTSKSCRRCGALLTVLAAQKTGQPSSSECLLSLKQGGQWESREFKARSMPLTVAGHPMTLLTLRDISALKRRETLERIFIHDLKNTLQGLRGWTEMLQAAGTDATVVAERILDLAGHVTAEVESMSHLLQAEGGELVADFQALSPARLLDTLWSSLGAEVTARLIQLPVPPKAPSLRTDPAILCRILSNMVLNALEAMPAGGQALIWYERRPGHPVFVVQNPGCMPTEVADQVFTRSFSTKAERGRGLGTYGMKLLGEKVLGGRVGFTTSWEEGTRFFIELPAGD
jgi:signal transduction histidine kinase